MKKAYLSRLAWLWVTVVWLCGLFAIFGLGVLWLGLLGVAIYLVSTAHSRNEVEKYALGFILVLVIVGVAFVRLVNRFYDWSRDQRLKFLLKQADQFTPSPDTKAQAWMDRWESEFTSGFSEGFKRQLRESPTFHVTARAAASGIVSRSAGIDDSLPSILNRLG